MSKIIDCITFFDENYIFDLRYNTIKDCVDKIVVCESIYTLVAEATLWRVVLQKNSMAKVLCGVMGTLVILYANFFTC